MSDSSPSWFIWTVRQGKLDAVVSYLDSKVKGITGVICPTVVSEKQTKTGKTKTKVSPLFGSYIFVSYVHDHDNPVTWVEINEHPFVVGYVGPCSASDIASLPK